MRRAERLKAASTLLGSAFAQHQGVTARDLSERSSMDYIDAKKALHSVWVSGDGIKRSTNGQNEYVYWKDRAGPGVGSQCPP
tara:strand:+ start:46 stop:291 length:246 start_codon:yes stop_codon:yes gene_type:complete